MFDALIDPASLPITWRGAKWVHTLGLARLLGSDTMKIRAAYAKHRGKFCLGEQFLRLSKDDLRQFKLSNCSKDYPAHNTCSRVMLWSISGVELMAQLLEEEQSHA